MTSSAPAAKCLNHGNKVVDIEDGEDAALPRAPRVPLDLAAITAADPGGRMARMRSAGDRARREFILIRDATGVVKMALSHVPVFRALVRATWGKRVLGVADAGVTLAEIAETGGLDPLAIRTALRSLVRNRAVRRRTVHTGYQGRRAFYYPSERGEVAIGIADILGEGAFVQVGRQVNAWKDRSMTEPPNVFQMANLISRGLAPEKL